MTAKTKNTIDLTLINSNSDEITSSGPCCDKEIKAICKVIHSYHNREIKIKIKKQAQENVESEPENDKD